MTRNGANTTGRHLRLVTNEDEDPDPGPDPLSQTLTEWAAWMRAQNMSERTVTDRVQLLARIATLHGVDPRAMTESEVATVLGGPAGSERWKPGTRANYHHMLKAWFSYLTKRRHRTDNPIDSLPKPKVPRSYPRPITTAQLERMLNVRMKKRTRAMILLAAYQGLRVGEVAKVHADDLDLDGGTLFVAGKGGVEDVLPLHPDVAEIADSLAGGDWWFPTYKPNVLFPDADGHVLSRSVSTIIGNVMTRADVPGTAHCLRHWYGTELLASGADTRTVQTLMRHASLASTQIYTHVADTRRAAAVMRLPRVGKAS